MEIIVENTVAQEIEISTDSFNQEITVSNTSTSQQPIEIHSPACQSIDISTTCPFQNELQVAIDSKVPKTLNILPQATDEQLSDRNKGRIYIDIDGSPSFVALEQIKKLNTKIIRVDELTDNRIDALSNEDYILLRKD